MSRDAKARASIAVLALLIGHVTVARGADPATARPPVPSPEPPPQVNALIRPDSLPRLVHKIEFGDYGSKYLRLGDLDGDGRHDMLVVQVKGRPEEQDKPVI